MDTADRFNAGTNTDGVPRGDAARQAVDSLRGYVYQALTAALAWVDIGEKDKLYLEVAEDYAIIAEQALNAVQVKDTAGSGPVTLNSPGVQKAVEAFVRLVDQNPNLQIDLRFFSTSEIGRERALADRPAGMDGLKYWRKIASGAANLSPLRSMLESDKFPESVRAFTKARDDVELRRDLFARIHWDCGRADSPTLRQELEARLVVVGRKHFSLPAPEAAQLADHLIYEVLRRSILENPRDRALTRADLYRLIDAVNLISVPRSVVNTLVLRASNSVESPIEGLGTGVPVSLTETGWLIDGTALPAPRGMVARGAVESAVTNALLDLGVSVLVGSSGLGKSIVARAVACARADEFFIVDFRDNDVDETRHRLDMVFSRVGGLPSSTLILEDLNHLEDPKVVSSLARVIEASRRRDREVLITCYRKPDSRALTQIGLDQGCVVNCPYFSEEETRALVHNNGGNPDIWGPLAHTAGSLGHPQLTHSFISGAAARKWPAQEIDAVFSRGLSSVDIDESREAVRRLLPFSLREEARNLLYRLSLVYGHFSRSLAIEIGEIPPQVSQIGESMDQLIGPWIETRGKDLFRVSPLAGSFGGQMLSPKEQKHIHQTIADQMVRHSPIDARDLNTVVMHAIHGESPEILKAVAYSLNLLDSQAFEALAEYPLIFRFFQTEAPIYPKELYASWMLRYTQFKLVVAAGDRSHVAEIVTALLREISSLPEGEPRRALEATSLATMLCTKGIANYLDDWLFLLLRLKSITESNHFLHEFIAATKGVVDGPTSNILGVLFSIGSANLASVERLEHVIDGLAELDTSVRASLLAPIDNASSDYSVFVNGSWATRSSDETFDAADAMTRYQRMAEKTRSWGIPDLSRQFSIAQAIMLDEYRNKEKDALTVLEEAVTAMGPSVILSRAIAKVYFRHEEYKKALEILRNIADQVGVDEPIERAYALREAAISAAECEEWSLAEKWFREARDAAERASGDDDMKAMAIGLGADSAVATLKLGDVQRALPRFAEVVESLADIDPGSTPRGAYTHHLIRNAALWVHAYIEEFCFKSGREPTRMAPGSCSNSDPLPGIRELPLRHIDVTWYTLARAEAAAGLDVGITAGLDDRLAQGPIPIMEFSLRLQTIQGDIDRLDTLGFAAHFTPFVESAAYSLSVADRLRMSSDPLTPERGQVPTFDKHLPFLAQAEQTATGAILAYGICSAMEGRPDVMTGLEAALDSRFPGPFPGKAVFDQWNGKPTELAEWDQDVASIIQTLTQQEHVTPRTFCLAGLRILHWIKFSLFQDLLTPRLAAWQRCGWKRIATKEKFRLSLPKRNAPRIEDILSTPTNDQRFVANLLLAASESVGITLEGNYRNTLKAFAEGIETAPDARDDPKAGG